MSTAKARVRQARALNAEGWEAGRPAQTLLHGLSQAIDDVILSLWDEAAIPGFALFAVGGYGRGELSPYSDIDLMLLAPDHFSPDDPTIAQAISDFVTQLWDCGLDAGHSVRTLQDCVQQAREDLTVATSLLEARQLAGDPAASKRLSEAWRSTIDRKTFAQGKLLEMQQRHARYHDTPYSLEPNIKESPGGLRDLQVIAWVAQAYKLGRSWSALAQRGLISPEEARQLTRQQRVLQTFRAQLHLTAGRREDRLVFDLQNQLATRMGFIAKDGRRASERLMQRYYRAAKLVQQVTALLLANLEATLWQFDQPEDGMGPASSSRLIDDHFQETHGLLDIRHDRVFEESPNAILRAFLEMERASSRRGMTARTLRALWNARTLVNKSFREDPVNRQTFIQIFQEPRGIVHALRIMNNLGILGRMLPVFRRIVGQMQHDLFHVYTVDQHILQVIRNLRRLTMVEHAHELPELTELMADFDAPWKLYLAALFHDIAKGRGGDHSELGEVEVRKFCRQFSLDSETADLLSFLVAQHLTMSTVAQKQDLADPAVIEQFAALVQTPERLTALYLLTVSDIRGTSPKVWNSWKARLLAQLYRLTRAFLAADNPEKARDLLGRQALVAKKSEAERLLLLGGRDPEPARRFWKGLDLDYFMRHEASDLAWHARMLAYRPPTGGHSLVFARPSPESEDLQVVVYVQDQPSLFARITAYFDAKAMPIRDARVHTTRDGFALDTFLIDAQAFEDQRREMASLVAADLTTRLAAADGLATPTSGRLSRQSKHFPIPPTVDLRPELDADRYSLSITATDRPGLLYRVAFELARYNIEVISARVTTLGERAEDVFLVSGPALAKEKTQIALEADLLKTLAV